MGRHGHAVLTLILLAPTWTSRAHTKGLHTSRNASTSSCGVTFDQSIGPAVDLVLLRFPLHTAYCLLLCSALISGPSLHRRSKPHREHNVLLMIIKLPLR
jgi:hypothetical protein